MYHLREDSEIYWANVSVVHSVAFDLGEEGRSFNFQSNYRTTEQCDPKNYLSSSAGQIENSDHHHKWMDNTVHGKDDFAQSLMPLLTC